MTDREVFELIVEELGALVSRVEFLSKVVVIGGQVLALERLAAGEDPVLRVETDTGQVLERGYTMEPDLLVEPINPAESPRWDELGSLLRECGYQRTGRSHRWEKGVGQVTVQIDLFTPDDAPEQGTAMTRLPRGEEVLARSRIVRIPLHGNTISVATPEPATYLLTKLDAAVRLRRNPKDAFDLYAYAKRHKGEIARGLAGRRDRDRIASDLRQLFGTAQSSGIADVLSHAPMLEALDRELVTVDIVQTFRELE